MERYWKRTACPHDCANGCGWLVETDGEKIYRIKGDPEHPASKGLICEKTAHYEHTVHHPDRLTTPLRRVGKKGEGVFEAIRWEEAVTEITTRWKEIIARYGAEAILPYSYAGCEHKIQYAAGHVFFDRLGAAQLERTICAKAQGEGFHQIIGSTPGVNLCDLHQNDYIILWGNSVRAVSVHACKEILEAKKKGAHVVLIETYETESAELADEVLLVRPGTDAYLALAMGRIQQQEGLLDQAFLEENSIGYKEFLDTLADYSAEQAEEITGVDKEKIRSVARGFARAKAPVIRVGAGVSRHQNGAMNVRCITAFAALSGSFAKKNGGISGNISSASAYDLSLLEPSDVQKKPVRTINMNQIGSALCERENGPIMSLYVYSANPACIAPNQSKILEGLAREDLFTVVHERFLTDTAKYADIVLPADMSVEHADLAASYGNLCIQKTEAVIAPAGECKSNFDTFALLGRAMGFEEALFQMTNEQVQAAILQTVTEQRAQLAPQEQERFEQGYAVLLKQPDSCAFATKSGKIEFLRPDLPESLPRYVAVERKYPLHLVVAPHKATLNSSFAEREELVEKRGRMSLLVSPGDAQRRGICDGAQIDVWNDLAHVRFYAKLHSGVPEGTVVAEGVYTQAQSINGLTVNALLSEELTDSGRAATLCGNTVEMAAISEEFTKD